MDKPITRIVQNMELVWSSGPHEYEYVTLEILLDANPVVVVNREAGLDNLEVELFGPLPQGWMLYKLPLDHLNEDRRSQSRHPEIQTRLAMAYSGG